MFLPQIAPPVERRPLAASSAGTNDVTAQATCVCRDVGGTKTWWCIIGKDMVNTKMPCV